MPTLTLHFRKRPRDRGRQARRSWFRDISSFCRGIYGDQKHEELRQWDRRSDLDLRDYVDLMLVTALPECRIHHDSQEVEVEVDFPTDAEAVAFHLRYVNFDAT